MSSDMAPSNSSLLRRSKTWASPSGELGRNKRQGRHIDSSITGTIIRAQSLDREYQQPVSSSLVSYDLWLTFEENHRKRTDEASPSHDVLEADSGLCDKCKEVNIELLEAGYDHSSLADLVISAIIDECKLCIVILRLHKARNFVAGKLCLDHYTVHLSIEEDLYALDGPHKTLGLPSYAEFKYVLVETSYNQPRQVHQVASLTNSDELIDVSLPSDSEHPERARDTGYLTCFTDSNDYTPTSDSWPTVVLTLTGNTSSTHSLDIARDWLRQCITSGQEDSSYPWKRPARLIQVISTDLEPGRARLVETRNEHYEYATLSYCWGNPDDPYWLTTTKTLRGHLQSIEVDSLPPTLRDSLRVSVELGVAYIWIDSLCVIQDSPSDWAAESMKMGAIYHGSIVTIAACASESATGGLFNNRSQSSFRENPREDMVIINPHLSNHDTRRLYLVPYRSGQWRHFERDALQSALSDRAWTLQEHIFARRTLYFTRSQLMWECKHCRLSEDNFPQGLPMQVDYSNLTSKKPLTKKRSMAIWYEQIVREYSGRRLSYFSDKMMAVAAVAEAMYTNRNVDYVSGLWKDSILEGMTWYRDFQHDRIPHCRKRTDCDFPSWSWASQESYISYEYPAGREMSSYQYSMDREPIPRVVGTTVNPNNARFGNATTTIILKTFVTSGVVSSRNSPEFYRFYKSIRHQGLGIFECEQPLFFNVRGHQVSTPVPAIMDTLETAGTQVLVAALGEYEYTDTVLLLLVPTNSSATQFRRVGLADIKRFTIPCSYDTSLANLSRTWDIRQIEIV